jgi:A/G-specific adenine glycosylase
VPPRARKPSASPDCADPSSSPASSPPPTTAHELLSSQEIDRIRAALLGWYRRGHRDLPWRQLRDPYAIWISEIMLQQTRVQTVKEYFRRFMARFPTIAALAAAPSDQVLELWSGLGYYARARNMHAAAAEIVARYGGEFPREPAAVRSLPGIGPYTAGAILSIAFGQRAALLDGNVIRVLARLRALTESPESAAGKRLYWSLCEALVPAPAADSEANDPGDFNQALMELGATVCTPQRPTCLVCPLAAECLAYKRAEVESFPPRKAARVVPVVRALTLVLRRGRAVLLVKRPAAGLWGGLWEPPTITLGDDEAVETGLARLYRERLGWSPGPLPTQPLQPFVHVLTHREMRFAPLLCDLPPRSPLPRLRLSGYDEARFFDLGQPLALGVSAWVTTLLRRIAAVAPMATAATRTDADHEEA